MKKIDTTHGQHIIVDIYGASSLDSVDYVSQFLRDASSAARATLLEIVTHDFGEGSGVTAVALLAESHMSIHSWPEDNYAALDFFTCGDSDVEQVLPVIKRDFSPVKMEILRTGRGHLSNKETETVDLIDQKN